MNKKILLTISLTIGTLVFGFAQQDLSLYFMEDIQQSAAANPALFPRHHVNVNLVIPIPSISINAAHSGFTFHQMVKKNANDDSTHIDGDALLSKMGKRNLFYVHVNVDYFSTNFKVKKFRFSLGATEKVSINLLYPKELFGFVWDGNVQYEGETIDMGLSLKAMHYREFAFGMGYSINRDYNLGFRFKYLQGLGCIHTKKNDLLFSTGRTSEAFAYKFETDYLVNIAGVGGEEMDFNEYFLNGKNPGWGLDLGGTYRYSDDWSFSASIIDLGAITWKSEVENYTSNGSYDFLGVDIGDFLVKTLVDQDSVNISFDEVRDSVIEEFNFEETSNTFRTSLITKVYLGAKYHIDSTSSFGILFFGQFFEGLRPAVTLAYNKRFGKALTIGGYYSYKHRSFLNLGFSAIVDAKPFQYYMATDNFLGPIFPRHSKNVNFRMGINWTFDKPKPKIKKRKKKRLKKTKVKKEKEETPADQDKEIFEEMMDD